MLGGLFHLTNLHLEYFDGYIYAGVTPMYVQPPPVAPHTVHDHPSAPKTHDHPLPMNGGIDEEEEDFSRHYSHYGHDSHPSYHGQQHHTTSLEHDAYYDNPH